MYEFCFIVALLTLFCYFILTSGKEGARTIVRNAYANYPHNVPYMQEYLEANAGIYVAQFVFGSFAKLQFKILVVGGWLCLPIAAYSIYVDGLLAPLSGIAGATFILKICTDTESFYSYNISPQLLTENTVKRLKKKFPNGVPAEIYDRLPQYDNVACQIMRNTFSNHSTPRTVTKATTAVTNSITKQTSITPLRSYLKIALDSTPETKSRQLAVNLMRPLFYFKISNIEETDKINSDETLIEVAAIYYQILFSYALNNSKSSSTAHIVFESQDLFTSVACIALGKNCTAKDMEDRIKVKCALATRAVPTFPSIEDLISYLIQHNYDTYTDDETIENLSISVKTWGNTFFPSIFEMLDNYTES